MRGVTVGVFGRFDQSDLSGLLILVCELLSRIGIRDAGRPLFR
jgi:hypothetical protein